MRRRFLAILILLLICSSCFGATYTGTVTAVHDGDTIKVLHNASVETVRLYGIDAPELAQPYGDKSRDYLAGLIINKSVSLESIKQDQYNRTLAIVSLNGTNINQQMVKTGCAWYCRDYVKDTAFSASLVEAQSQAQNNKTGLWAAKDPEAPWDFKERQKTGEAKEPAAQSDQATVYVTASNNYYHKRDCQKISRSRNLIPLTLSDAQKQGYRRCKFCSP